MRGLANTFFPLRGRSAEGAEGASAERNPPTRPHLTALRAVVRPQRGQKA
jgi:hypothetical protein